MLSILSRYRISGSSLLAAMDKSSLVPSTNLTPQNLDNEETEVSQADVNKESKSMLDSSLTHGNEEKISQVDESNMRGQPPVDIAEVLRRWTHALKRIHKQSLQLVCSFMQNQIFSSSFVCEYAVCGFDVSYDL